MSWRSWLIVIIVGSGLALLAPNLQSWLRRPATAPSESAHAPHAHGGASNSIVLSPQAKKNLGLRTLRLQRGDHWRTLSIPSTVVERPGHSHRKITTPIAGLVKEVHVHPNQLVHPGDLLMELEMTGEILANTQADLLTTLREIELSRQELERITPLVQGGAMPEKARVDIELQLRRYEAQQTAKEQTLEILGLTGEQVQQIRRDRKLLRAFSIRAPGLSSEEKLHLPEHAAVRAASGKPPAPTEISFTVESIDVYPGKRVAVGEELGSLAFHVTLFLEGQAFANESEKIGNALVKRWPIRAEFQFDPPTQREDLLIQFVDNVVDEKSRIFRFFLPLVNEVLHDTVGPAGEVYRSWRYKPGQKALLEVPIEKLTDVLAVPAAAVVREGPEAYVFRVNGDKFERQAVVILRSEHQTMVLADDGSVFPGDELVTIGAYQIHLAIKSAQGGGADPHAGHSH